LESQRASTTIGSESLLIANRHNGKIPRDRWILPWQLFFNFNQLEAVIKCK